MPALVVTMCLLGVLFLLPVVLRPAAVANYYLALILTILTLLPLAVRIASGTFDVFEPIVPISLLICLAFGLRAMFIAFDPDTLLPISLGQFPFSDYMDRALTLTLAAYAFLCFGYFIIAKGFPIKPLATRRFARRTWSASSANPIKVAVLLGVAVIATYVSSNSDSRVTGTVTNATSILGILASFCHVGATVMALYLASGDQRPWLRAALWGIAVPLAAWQSLAFGAKAYILQLFYVIIAAWHYAKRRVRLSILAVCTVALVLIVFPIVNGYRQDPDDLRRLLSRITPSEYGQLAAESLLSRSTGIDSLSLLMKYDVSDRLGHPDEFALIPVYAFVPRLFWPDKPFIEQGTNFGRLFIDPSLDTQDSSASFGIFHIGDLFVSFGIPGVLVGMCVLGCVFRLTYKFFDPLNSKDLGIKAIYILLLWDVVAGFQADVPSVYGNILKNLAVWTAIKIWLNEPLRGGARRPAPHLRWQRLTSPPTLAARQPAGLHSADVRDRFAR